MVTVGLAGGSGSGKGHLSAALRRHGIPSFDCDAVYHSMIEADSPVCRELAAEFGEQILNERGGVHRPRLAEIVFAANGAAHRARLNEITHRHILSKCRVWLDGCRAQGCRAALVDAPLLFESGFDILCDLTVAMIAPKDTRIDRICRRDGITAEQAARRIDAQISDLELIGRADFVFDNSGDEGMFGTELQRLLNKIKEIES